MPSIPGVERARSATVCSGPYWHLPEHGVCRDQGGQCAPDPVFGCVNSRELLGWNGPLRWRQYMRVRSRGLTLAVFALAASGARAVSAQGWDDRFRWYVGGHAGVVGFETPSQTRAWVPTVGGSLLVVAKRTGLLLELDEGLGSNEATAFGDNTASTGIRNVTFDRV